MLDVSSHKNVEQVIRYYLLFMPPRGCGSILDIGAGINTPYKGVLRTRCKLYRSFDIRQNPNETIDYVRDLSENTEFEDGQWHWGWCSEVLEHIPSKLKQVAFTEILRICKNVVFTFPTPKHQTFFDDVGHVEVKINPNNVRSHIFIDKSTKSGRNIWIFHDKNIKTTITNRGLLQDDCNPDNLPFVVKNNKMIFKPKYQLFT